MPSLTLPEIVSDAAIMGGWPCISGTRVPVYTIAAELQAGAAESEIEVHYALPRGSVEAVRRWAAANRFSLEPGAPLLQNPDEDEGDRATTDP